jgi:segregation and condensation protein B
VDAVLLKKILEGAIFAAGQPMNIEQLGLLFDEAERPSNSDMRVVLDELKAEYAERGVELKEVASGFRFQVRQETGPWVSRLWDEKPSRYSRALLETLALIAYRQPITRSEIEEIRGVSVSSHIIKTLIEREWIRVAGHRDVPGRPALFATTREFLDSFNLKNLAELPSLSEIRDLDSINAELEFLAAQPQDEGGDIEEQLKAEQLADVMAELEEDIKREESGATPDEQIYE